MFCQCLHTQLRCMHPLAAGAICEVDLIPPPGVLKFELGQGEVIHLNLELVRHGMQVHQQVHAVDVPLDIHAPVGLMMVVLSRFMVMCKWVLSTKPQKLVLDVGVGIKDLIIVTAL